MNRFHILLTLALLASMAQADPTSEPVSEPASNPVIADNARDRFLQAEQALASGHIDSLNRLSTTLADYPLTPDLTSAAIVQRLSSADAEEVRQAIEAQVGTAPGERLRRLWLARLAREQRWDDYIRDYVDNGSETRECLYRYALAKTGDQAAAFTGLEQLYLSGRSLPDACDPLFAAWADSGALGPDLVWRRVELALTRGDTGVARYQRRYLPEADRPWLDYRLAASRQPPIALQPPAGKHPRRDAIIAAALSDLARRDPQAAIKALKQPFGDIPEADAGLVHATAGLALLERGETTQARAELDRLPPGAGDERLQLARLRAGLKLKAWPELARWIQALPEDVRHLALWQYWLGRALEQRAREQTAVTGETKKTITDAAREAYARAADDRSLWGFLAAEHLGQPVKTAHQPTPISTERLQSLLTGSRAARLRELKALGRDLEANREWREYRTMLARTHQGADQVTALQEAAVLARTLGFPIQAIMILAQSNYWDDLELRFPLLYTELITEAAQRTGLPESWLLAVIRQESIFDEDIVSPAGAMGLMQLMPATARAVARQERLAAPTPGDLQDPALNIQLGSRYLSDLQKTFGGHPALATAAYNAGPGAVKRWLPEQPLEADLWIATIPYAETRTYVARVLAYRLLYAHRLGQPLPNLTKLLPPIGQNGAGPSTMATN